MLFPDIKNVNLSKVPAHGRFGTERKYDVHTGLDIYCEEGQEVYAIESGIVVGFCQFTGQFAGSPWWKDTWALLVKGESGVILYGEIRPKMIMNMFVNKGDEIGKVKRVLKKDKGLPMTMLHLELYEHGYRGQGEWWKLGDEKPNMLLNIESLVG